MDTPGITTIEISKEQLHFSAAHFTLFSRTERENLHGHNFYVTAQVESPVGENGLAFDYNELKSTLKILCEELDEKVLLPEKSPYLDISNEGDYLIAKFADERIPFLPRDVLVLAVRNITVEELAPWFLQRVRQQDNFAALNITKLTIGVSSGPGQWARAAWEAS
ncbi:MAG: 6-carboxytetrahydropterin synthase [Gammaproteobacteria bacterium]|nr:6-carboxytetrahydropterin synthase [Gammaproteobacteria bacterium]